MSKPVLQAELRVDGEAWQLLLRRQPSESFRLTATGSLSGTAITEEFTMGNLRLDGGSVFLDGERVALSPAQYSVLDRMIREPKRIFNAAELAVPRQVIYRLRAKLRRNFVVNHRGRGWSLIER